MRRGWSSFPDSRHRHRVLVPSDTLLGAYLWCLKPDSIGDKLRAHRFDEMEGGVGLVQDPSSQRHSAARCRRSGQITPKPLPPIGEDACLERLPGTPAESACLVHWWSRSCRSRSVLSAANPSG
jgi:hypothetical protein